MIGLCCAKLGNAPEISNKTRNAKLKIRIVLLLSMLVISHIPYARSINPTNRLNK